MASLGTLNLRVVVAEKKERKKMLFVDDRWKRIEHALNNFLEFDVVITPCVPEALRYLWREDWDVVSLDHDLNGHDFQDPDEKTCGMEFVRYILKTGWPQQRGKPQFWIHSSNLGAANLMITELTKAGYEAWYKPIIYPPDNMQYDIQGNPL